MEITSGWWADGRTGAKRHRLRTARDNQGRRIAACGARAPNGWTRAGDVVGVECQVCVSAAAIEDLGR
jgi:hypothetical protein